MQAGTKCQYVGESGVRMGFSETQPLSENGSKHSVSSSSLTGGIEIFGLYSGFLSCQDIKKLTLRNYFNIHVVSHNSINVINYTISSLVTSQSICGICVMK